MVYLNMDITEDMWGPITEPDRIERGISYAASIVSHAISQGIDVGFGSNGYTIDEPKQPVRVFPAMARNSYSSYWILWPSL